MSDVKNETPTWAQVINNAIDRKLLDVHVSLPAQIEKFDGVRADVRPLLKRQLRDETEFELPIITNVPVIWPATAKAELNLPIKVGDTGSLLFCERSLDIWLVKGGSINPKDFRKFNLSDAQFIPGLRPFDVATAFDPLRVILKNDVGVLSIKEDGKINFTNGVEEMMDLVKQLIDKVSEMNDKISVATTNTIFGPLQLNNFADFITLMGEVDTIGTKWDTLKE